MGAMTDPLIPWCVWFDRFNEEPLALEEAACSPALLATLAEERTPIHRVRATHRRAAVRQVFPPLDPDRDSFRVN